jgi:aspartyl-tRNA(Asn)/glutamyl-tRNA(Gln) amidotransferase subunit C
VPQGTVHEAYEEVFALPEGAYTLEPVAILPATQAIETHGDSLSIERDGVNWYLEEYEEFEGIEEIQKTSSSNSSNSLYSSNSRSNSFYPKPNSQYPPRMPALTKDQVRHIAKLARLDIAEGDLEKFAKELTSILGYIDMLNEVDTSKVMHTAQVTGLSNALREDEVLPAIATPDALLATSPLPIEEHQIETASAHD